MFNWERDCHKVLKRSSLAHHFQRDGVSCLYHSLRIIPLYYTSELESHVAALHGSTSHLVWSSARPDLRDDIRNLIEAACDCGIFVPERYREQDYLDRVGNLVRTAPKLRVLVLHLTDMCNLQCRYCFIEGGKPDGYINRSMNLQTAQLAVDRFVAALPSRVSTKTPSVVFYGGEPLLNSRVFAGTLRYLTGLQERGDLPPDLGKVLITNGTLITPDIAALIHDHDVSVSISIDGPAHVHDRDRPYPDGSGSLTDTLRGLEQLRSQGVKPTVASVMSEHGLPHVSETLRWLIEELEVQAIGFNHMSIVPNRVGYNPEYEEGFADAILLGQEIV